MNFKLQDIKNADRNPIANVQNALTELNGFAKDHVSHDISMQWHQGVDKMGPCLHAIIKFKNVEACLKFAIAVYDLQEKVDHHSHFVIDNFLTVDMKLSTHHPAPAITNVDFLFAKYTIRLLSNPAA